MIGGAFAFNAIGVALEASSITVGQAVVLHGAVGGIQAEITGGNFLNGFAAGVLGKGVAANGGGFAATVAAGAVGDILNGGNGLMGR